MHVSLSRRAKNQNCFLFDVNCTTDSLIIQVAHFESQKKRQNKKKIKRNKNLRRWNVTPLLSMMIYTRLIDLKYSIFSLHLALSFSFSCVRSSSFSSAAFSFRFAPEAPHLIPKSMNGIRAERLDEHLIYNIQFSIE